MMATEDTLGIAYQLDTQWREATAALRRAIDLDPDYELAYNSLALTQKKCGELDKALHNYDAGAKALSRRIMKSLKISRTSPILKHRETRGHLWVEYALYAAVHDVSGNEDIHHFAWPSGEDAREEELSERHAGLYWVDELADDGGTVRMFLPNFFNTIRELLRQDAAYSNLIGNRGTVLELLGRQQEADLHFAEAVEFQPDR
jgi:tetratricopeptide (TPR) repeat protein